MRDDKPRITVVILENRQMIAAILADLLEEAGYSTRHVAQVTEVQGILAQCLPAFLLVDQGMILPNRQAQWDAVAEMAGTLGVPVLSFSCSPLPGQDDILILRSPGDFAMAVERVEEEWRRKQPYLGMTLVEMGVLVREDLEAVLRVQKELVLVGRQHSLGDLLVRLGIVSQKDLEEALRRQEL